MPTQTPNPGSRTPDPATAAPDTAPTPPLKPETCTAMQEQQTAIPATWQVRVHPFGGGYCVARKGESGRTEHFLSPVGVAPAIQSFPLRGEAQTTANWLNGLPSCLMGLQPTELEAMTHAYLAAALWSSTDDEGDPLDDGRDLDDVAPSFKVHADVACTDFLRDAVAAGVTLDALRQLKQLRGMGFEQFGHDLWLTRNRHGAGFWDRGLGKLGTTLTEVAHAMGSRDAYLGDDGLVYVD